MTLHNYFVVVLVGLLCILSAVESSIIQPSNFGVVPGAYIAEFEDEFDHHSFFGNTSNSGIHTRLRRTLDHTHFSGASFHFRTISHDNETSHKIIRAMEGVKRIWPVRLARANALPHLSRRIFDPALRSLPHAPRSTVPDVYAPHAMSGVDQLRAEGYSGTGMFVGIVDTGVDYNHPALGGGFGPGFKIAAGYDLVGGKYDGTSDPIPDSDPMDCNGHGTHVSGIIGADTNPYNFTGVVPNATIGMWKVTGCGGIVANDIMISGFNIAFEAGVDVISSSIDFDDGWAEDPISVVVQRIVDAGVPVSVSAGNLGVLGPFNSQAPSVATGAISVGSVDSILNITAIQGSTTNLTVPPKILSSPNTLTGGYVSFFSSWGPSSEGVLKPQIVAPGGDILSTYPVSLGGYSVLSGTSMAVPYIAGVIALLKQIRGLSTTPQLLNSLLATTASPVNYQDFWNNETLQYLAPAIQQGGGLVDAYHAAHSSTILNPSTIALNDTSNFIGRYAITIQNLGNSSATYNLSHHPALSAYSLGMGVPYNKSSLATASAKVSFEPGTLIVAAGGAGVVVASFSPPEGLNASLIPVYSGFLSVNCTSGKSLDVPYTGIATDLRNISVMDIVKGYPFLASSMIQNYPNGTTSTTLSSPITASNASFTLAGNATNYTVTAYPTIVYKLQYGSRIVRIDIVPQNTTGLPTVLGRRVLGSISGYPSSNVGAKYTAVQLQWNGSVVNKTSLAAPGTYKFLVRVLKIFGNETSVDDYEEYSTPYFNVKYAS